MVWDPTVPAENAPLLSAPIRDNFAALDALMTGGGGVTFPLLASDGTDTAPAYSFASQTNAGFYHVAGAAIGVTGNNKTLVVFNYDSDGQVKIPAGGGLDWTASLSPFAAPDLSLRRDGAGILAQKNGSLNKLRVYGDATNYTEITGVAGLMTTVVNGSGVATIVALTQAAYDALTPKVATTLYVITP